MRIKGPRVLDVTQLANPWLSLSCSFKHRLQEYQQLDIKRYFSSEEEPFLQWVPSTGREHQVIGQRFRNRLVVRESARNTTDGFMIEQVVRVERPSVHLSGNYSCKVASFFTEQSTTHSLIIFGNPSYD